MSYTNAHRAKAAATRARNREEHAVSTALGNRDLAKNIPPPIDKGRYVTANQAAKRPGRINLRAVSEVLQNRGLDPTEALIDILESGRLDPDVQARILNELLQYTQPKLKSVEIKAKVAATSFDINDDQAKKIAEEFLRSGALTP